MGTLRGVPEAELVGRFSGGRASRHPRACGRGLGDEYGVAPGSGPVHHHRGSMTQPPCRTHSSCNLSSRKAISGYSPIRLRLSLGSATGLVK